MMSELNFPRSVRVYSELLIHYFCCSYVRRMKELSKLKLAAAEEE